MSVEASGLRDLLHRLRHGYVEKFGDSRGGEGQVTLPEIVDPGNPKANIVTSKYLHGGARHAVLLDIDYPAYLVKSSTPGHYHLYLDVPGGVAHEDYLLLLSVLSKWGVIEKGYARTSKARGFTSLRLPHIKKKDTP